MRPRGAVLVAGAAIVVAVAVGGGAWLVYADNGGDGGDAGEEPAGGDLPEATLVDFDGEATVLGSFAGDDPLVVNFYASWCPPCIGEMRDAFGPVDRDLDDVAFLGVALQDDPEAALDVAARTDVDYELVQDRDGALFQALGLVSMPATVFIDADGTVRGQHNGALTRGQLEDRIAEYLGEP